MAVNWQALEAIIKHYVLYDHQCRRSILVFMGLLGLATLVLALLGISGKLPVFFLFTISTAFLFTAGLGMPFMLAYVIQREKAEGSFRALRALPISSETLFLGTVLAGVVASVASLLAVYPIMVLAWIPRGAGWVLLLIYTGWASLLASFLFASFILTVALCVNSPTALIYLLAGFPVLISSLGMLMSLFKQKLRPLLENRLEKLFYFILSLEGQVLAMAILIVLSVMIFYVGSRIFSRKKSYV